jgi:hypothetical protein
VTRTCAYIIIPNDRGHRGARPGRYGLRPNPQGREFGEFGLCRIRFGRAEKGLPPKGRSVLTVFGWTPDILEEWFTEVRPLFGTDGNPAAWPSERA